MSPRPPAKRRRRTSAARRRKATGSEELWLIGLVGLVALSLVVAVLSWLAAHPFGLMIEPPRRFTAYTF